MAKKVLVVEDELDVLKVVSFVLRKRGYEVVEAVDGQQALALAYEKKPDLVVLDLFLPVLDGREVSAKLKADKQLRAIPILLLTASADNIIQKAQECNAHDYLLKPFDYTELLQKVEKLLQ